VIACSIDIGRNCWFLLLKLSFHDFFPDIHIYCKHTSYVTIVHFYIQASIKILILNSIILYALIGSKKLYKWDISNQQTHLCKTEIKIYCLYLDCFILS
jgi:hypothetical protein